MAGKRAKRFLRFLLWLLLIFIVLAVSFPLWFPWLLRPVARHFGATYQKHERRGYGGFAVTDVSFTNRNVTVRAANLEVDFPRQRVRARDWAVVVAPSDHPSTNASPSVHHVYRDVFKIVTNVQHWIVEAALTNGRVQTPAVRIEIPGVHWKGTSLAGQVQISDALPLTAVAAELPPAGPIHLHLSNPTMELKSSLTVSNTPEGIFIQSDDGWRTNEFQLSAKFGPHGALPESLALTANSVVFPPFKGDISLSWHEGRYAVAVQAAVQQQPISFTFQATGETNLAQIEVVELSAPWAQAKLSGQVLVDPALHSAELSLAGNDIRSGNIQASYLHLTGSLSRSNLAHAGSVLVQGLSTPGLNPFDLGLNWAGEKFNFSNVAATAAAAPSAIALTAAANLQEKHFRIGGLKIGTNELDLSADLRWPEMANVCAQMTNVSAQMLNGFVDLPHEDALLDHLRLYAGWDHGPLKGDMDFAGRAQLEDGTRLGIQGAITARAEGLTLTNFALTRNSELVSTIEGFIPVCIDVTQKPFAAPAPGNAMQVQATIHPDAFFWKILENRFGVALREPDLRAYLSGTWDQPLGRVSMRAASARFHKAAPEIPPLENLAFLAHLRNDAAELEFFNFFITNQPITFSGRMPLPEAFWTAPQTNAANLDWRNLSCRLKIDSAQIAGLVPFLSGIVAPQGIIDADIGLLPGGKLDGQLRIDGAATRPIAALGALQDIEILCRFAGEKARISSHVSLGGSAVMGSGEVQMDANQFMRRELPPFQFVLAGENVPLARQPDAIVRADVNVTVKHTAIQPVLITGNLNLRHSLFLRELRELVPGRLASADRRPPYFSVTAKPFSDWRIDLRVVGARFLKVRTPVFNGETSADLKLSGTLGNPVAVGDVTIANGLVRFPFGTIPITQGIISLSSDDPYRPQLLIHGGDRVLGYDVNMEVTGYADAPIIQFSSTPPLNSDQILLMLTAGEIPRQGEFAFTPEQRAQRVGLFLGRSMLSDLGIGGDSNRLTVRSGENVTETGRPTYSVEYQLTRDWSVIGQYDRFNDFNLMLKWRVYSR